MSDPDIKFVIIERTRKRLPNVFAFSDGSDIFELLDEALKLHPEKTYEAISFKKYLKRERQHYIGNNKKFKRISKKRYWEMLEVLPPERYTEIGGVTEFCMCEHYSGNYTTQYAHYEGKYYEKMVDVYDKSTWLHNNLLGGDGNG